MAIEDIDTYDKAVVFLSSNTNLSQSQLLQIFSQLNDKIPADLSGHTGSIAYSGVLSNGANDIYAWEIAGSLAEQHNSIALVDKTQVGRLFAYPQFRESLLSALGSTDAFDDLMYGVRDLSTGNKVTDGLADLMSARFLLRL